MKFFIDTGSIKEIRQAAEPAILDGVTTNPSARARLPNPGRVGNLKYLLHPPKIGPILATGESDTSN